jgi:hypothetical protein
MVRGMRLFGRMWVPALDRSPLGRRSTAGLVLAHALVDLYNPAQQRVLQRLDALLARRE